MCSKTKNLTMRPVLFITFFMFLFTATIKPSNAQSMSKLEKLIELSKQRIYSNPDSSLAYALEAKQLSIDNADSRNLSEALKQIGIYFYIRSQFDSALLYLTQAKQHLNPASDSAAIMKIDANIGNIFADNHQTEKAIEAYLKVYNWFDKSNDTLNRARMSVNIANLYLIKKQFAEALTHFAEAKLFFQKRNMRDELALIDMNTGYVYNELNQFDSATYYLKKAGRYYADKKLILQKAACDGNISEIHIKKNQYDSALIYVNWALESLAGQTATHFEANLRFQKADILHKQSNAVDALKNLYLALENTSQKRNKELVAKIYRKLSLVYLDMNQLKHYQVYNEQYVALQDSLYAQKIKSREDELLAEFGLVKRDREIELLKIKENLTATMIKKQQAVIIVFALLAILAGVIAFVLKYRNKLKNRINKVLIDKNEEIRAQSEEITAQNETLKAQKTEITDSLDYARFIQRVIFTPQETPELEYFRFNKPKDIVSGDFFWQQQTESYHYIAVADCTGHGVAGAFMSVLGFTFLNEVFNETPDIPVNEMLDSLRIKIKHALRHTDKSDSNKDGLDIALVRINRKQPKLQFAGAYRPCWIFTESEFIELKGDKQPIGSYPKEKPFTVQELEIPKSSTIYLFTDGLSDQINEADGKKLKIIGLQQLLQKASTMPIDQQENMLHDFLKDFMGDVAQIDDMLATGIKLKNH